MIGLLRDLIRIIMECIITVSMQLLWNGELKKIFIPSKESDKGTLYPLIFLSSASRGSVTESIRQFGMGVGNQSGLHMEAFLLLIYFLLMTTWCSLKQQLQNVTILKSCLIYIAMHLAKSSIFKNHLYFSVQILQETSERQLNMSSTFLLSLIISNIFVSH